jgi:catechol 2,3-dioxygenase-like lactoylglutathione lyase family enzyme
MTNHQNIPEHKEQVQFDGVVPILRVSDFDRSIAHYVDVLGFSLEWTDGRFGSVHFQGLRVAGRAGKLAIVNAAHGQWTFARIFIAPGSHMTVLGIAMLAIRCSR